MNPRIKHYRFSDSKAGIITTAAIHLVCGFIFFLINENPLFSFGRAQLCLIIACVFASLYKLYDWKNLTANLAIIAVYLFLLFAEWSLFGVPESPLKMSESGYSKGFIMNFIMVMMPWFYAGLRVFCILLLLHITAEAHRLGEE